MVPNRPSPEGIELGKEIARLADRAEAEVLAQFPNARTRCKTCAFRGGTLPNGCVATLSDAMKAVVERDPFMCHEKPAGEEPSEFCAGWLAAVSITRDMPKRTAPYEYSHVDDESET